MGDLTGIPRSKPTLSTDPFTEVSDSPLISTPSAHPSGESSLEESHPKGGFVANKLAQFKEALSSYYGKTDSSATGVLKAVGLGVGSALTLTAIAVGSVAIAPIALPILGTAYLTKESRPNPKDFIQSTKGLYIATALTLTFPLSLIGAGLSRLSTSDSKGTQGDALRLFDAQDAGEILQRIAKDFKAKLPGATSSLIEESKPIEATTSFSTKVTNKELQVCLKCIEKLNENIEEGLWRLSGSKREVDILFEKRLELSSKDFELPDQNIYVSLAKRIFREFPGGLIPTVSESEGTSKVQQLEKLYLDMGPEKAIVLDRLLQHLSKVKNAPISKMNNHTLGTTLGPSLMPNEEYTVSAQLLAGWIEVIDQVKHPE